MKKQAVNQLFRFLGGAHGFNTQLPPQDEQRFQDWALMNVPIGDQLHMNPNLSNGDYDFRGFFMDPDAFTVINPNDHQVHFTDRYKKPHHETFSNESKYSDLFPNDAGSWLNDFFMPAFSQMMRGQAGGFY